MNECVSNLRKKGIKACNVRVTCCTRFLREKFILEKVKNHLFQISTDIRVFSFQIEFPNGNGFRIYPFFLSKSNRDFLYFM